MKGVVGVVRCGCGVQCGCQVVAGDGVTVDGSGSKSTPYVISAEVTCDQVRPCLQAGPGIEYDPDTGTIGVDISETPGNTVIIDDGGLYVPAASGSEVVADCGLTGDGTADDPLAAATGTWPYACDQDETAGGVYCDSAGVLRSEPRGRIDYVGASDNQSVAATPVPAAELVVAEGSLDITNPDPCRDAIAIVNANVDVDFNLPAGSSAAYSLSGDEMAYFPNRGSTGANSVHSQGAKTWRVDVPAGGTVTEPISVEVSRGAGGAVYTRVQWSIRAFIIAL